jgi:hypothetical protein
MARRPMIQLLLAIALLVVAVVPINDLVTAVRQGGLIIKYELLLLGFPFLGLILIGDLFRVGWFLQIRSERGESRLRLDRAATPQEVRELIQAVRARWGIDVQHDRSAEASAATAT